MASAPVPAPRRRRRRPWLLGLAVVAVVVVAGVVAVGWWVARALAPHPLPFDAHGLVASTSAAVGEPVSIDSGLRSVTTTGTLILSVVPRVVENTSGAQVSVAAMGDRGSAVTLRIVPASAGRVRIRGLDVGYRQGSRRGTQYVITDIVVQTP